MSDQPSADRGPVPSERIRDLDRWLVARYSGRLAQYGESYRTLGWGSTDQQKKRFDVFVDSVPLAGRSIVDIGCGFGGFLDRLRERGVGVRAYVGLDINPDLVAVARERHPGVPFEARNLLLDPPSGPLADVAIAIGVLNLRLRDIDNYELLGMMMDAGLASAREALALDLLSSVPTEAYPKEDFVFYYEPGRVLDLAFSRVPYVRLVHDYGAIPQREMLVVMRNEPWK